MKKWFNIFIILIIFISSFGLIGCETVVKSKYDNAIDYCFEMACEQKLAISKEDIKEAIKNKIKNIIKIKIVEVASNDYQGSAYPIVLTICDNGATYCFDYYYSYINFILVNNKTEVCYFYSNDIKVNNKTFLPSNEYYFFITRDMLDNLY